MTRSVDTPWGVAQTTREIAPGITLYTTASHGGFYLTPERVAEMPKPLREFVPFGGPQPGPGMWLEEDCDWSVAALAFPQYFKADDISLALLTLQRYKPEIFTDFVALLNEQGKHVYSIHYADKEMAREHDDETLGIVLASSKEEAEDLADKDKYVNRRRVPCTSLWACEIKGQGEERGR